MALGELSSTAESPRNVAKITTAIPNRIPIRKLKLFLKPYVAPVAAKATGTGPGEPSSKNAVMAKVMLASSKLVVRS